MTEEYGRRLGKGHWSDPYDGAKHPDAFDPRDVDDEYDGPPEWDRFDPAEDADLGPAPTRRKRGLG